MIIINYNILTSSKHRFTYIKKKEEKKMYSLLKVAYLLVVCTTPILNPEPGKLIWNAESDVSTYSTPAIGPDGIIYVGLNFGGWTKDGKLYAFYPDGGTKWIFDAVGEIERAPSVDSDGTIYFGTASGRSGIADGVFALNPDGTEKWNYITDNNVESPISIGYDGNVYFIFDRKLYAFTTDGTFQWEYQIGTCAYNAAAVFGPDNTIYLGNENGELHAINADGTQKWIFKQAGEVGGPAAVGSDGTIYVGYMGRYTYSPEHCLYAVNPDGTEKWNFKPEEMEFLYSAPAIGPDNTIYISDDENNLYAINPNGEEKWNFNPQYHYMNRTPAIGADGRIYIGCSMNGYFHAINPDGSEEWMLKLGDGDYTSCAIGKNGTIYVVNEDYGFCAISSEAYGLANSEWPKYMGGNFNRGRPDDPAPPKDIGIVSIVMDSIVTVNNTHNVKVSIHNYGSESQSNFQIGYQVGNAGSVIEEYPNSISPSGMGEYTFNTPWTPDELGYFEMTAFTNLTGDQNTANDTLNGTFRAVYQNDIGISQIQVGPIIGIDRPVTITVELTNYGMESQGNFPVSYKIGSGSWITETYTGTIAFEERALFSFSEKWTPTSTGSYQITAESGLSGDQNTSNNSWQKSVDVVTAREGWYNQVSGTSVSLNSVHFSDVNNGWAVGEYGIIMHTRDGGEFWSTQTSGDTAELRSVYFTDAYKGWAAGEEGIIIHTNDGGENWSTQYSRDDYYLNGLFFMDANNGYAVGYYFSFSGWTITYYSRILHTTDGGENWSNQLSQTHIRVRDIHFIDQNNGWAVGDRFELWETTVPVAIHTTDGGDNWSTLYFQTPGSFDKVFFIDANNGWIVGVDSTIINTTDGGENWFVQPALTSSYLFCIYFTDSNTGWAAGGGGTIMHTTDGGENWNPQISCTSSTINSMHFIDAYTGWAVGNDGTIIHTMTGGVATGIKEDDDQPHSLTKSFSLAQNYPNPFNPNTTIEYSLFKNTFVSLKVFDILGQEVRTLVQGKQSSGHYKIQLNNKDLPSGVYIYRLETEYSVQSRRMIILK